MKIFKTLIILPILLVCMPFSHAQQLNKRDILHPEGLLWKIEKPEMLTSYVYGTMHVSDPRVVELDPLVEKAFIGADQFVMEMVLNFKAMGYVTSASFFSDGKTLPSLMEEADYKRLLVLLKKRLNFTDEVVRNMKPWAVLMALLMPVEELTQTSVALDMVLFKRASELKKVVGGLETAEEQVNVFDEMSLADQVWLLNRSVEEIATTDNEYPKMLEAYLDRNLAELVLIQKKFDSADSDIDDRFIYRLLDMRNKRMANRMQKYLLKGNAFIAVGALHLPGETGVLHLLEQQGYTVSVVY